MTTDERVVSVRMRAEAILLQGWSAYLCAILAGCLWTLAFAPFFLLPAAYLSFALPCLWVAYDLPRRRGGGTRGVRSALALMSTWAFAAFLSSLYWISHAVWLSFGQSLGGAVAGVFATLALCAVLASFPVAALFAFTLLLRKGDEAPLLARLGLFVCLFALAESLRGMLFGGLPWNLVGYAWNVDLRLLQTNALAGIELTGFLALLSYALVALALFSFAHGKRRASVCSLLCAVAIPLGSAAFGAWRLSGATEDGEKDSERPAFVRIVQPNIQQQKKWRVEDALVNYRRTLDLSLRDRPASVALLLWPETSFPYRLTTEAKAVGQPIRHLWISPLIEVIPQWLVFGAPRINRSEGELPSDTRLRNSLLMLDARGRLQGLYDKERLVPFGEFIPFSNNRFVRNTKTLTSFPSFARGDGNPLLHADPTLTLEVQICYESIFPNLFPFFVPDSTSRPDLLFNATNDGWFGRSIAPYQHLAMARVRAVERGLPFFRAANTGISAVFDPFGRELARLPLGESGVIDAPLAKKTTRGLLTSRFGNGLFWLSWFIVATLCLVFVKRKSR